MAVRTRNLAYPGAIYRPLSIATSVENDWARRGPFWQVPLTLPLETIDFLKKIANHENPQNCRKRYIFLLYPKKWSKKCTFFASAERSPPPFATRRSHGIQTKISDFFRPPESENFALFFDFSGPDFLVSGQLPDQISGPGQSRDFATLAVRMAILAGPVW